MSLRNFRKFKRADIDFATDPNQEVTVIRGENTYGKTTLVRAFLWCLYREDTFKTKSLLNSDVDKDLMVGECANASVEIVLDHNGYRYSIKTTEVYEKKVTYTSIRQKAFTRVLRSDGNGQITIPDSRVDAEINSILRDELKNYFFFDGETNTIESVREKSNLKDAVFDILNMNNIKRLKEYYDPNKTGYVVDAFDHKIKGSHNGQINVVELARQRSIADSKQTYDEYNKKIDDANAEIASLTETIDRDEQILNEGAAAMNLQEEKNRIEKSLENAKNSKGPTFNDLVDTINNGDSLVKTLYSYTFQKENLEEKLGGTTFGSKDSYIGINEDGVRRLIERGECVCGAKIENGNDAYKHLIEATQHMEPHDYGKYLHDFIDSEKSNISSARSTASDIRKLAKKEVDICAQIDDLTEERNGVVSRISDQTDYGAYAQEVKELNRKVDTLKGSIKAYEETIKKAQEEISRLEDEERKAAERSKENDFVYKCIEYCRKIYNAASKTIEEATSKMVEDLQKEVQTIFDKMYSGRLMISIDDNFKVSAHLPDGRYLDDSQGLGMVLNYSFVLGLMNLAKNSSKGNRYQSDLADEEETDENYPLVMDAPFSSTDSGHISNICKVLPEYCDQVVMVLMDKDYNYAKGSIGSHVGKEYVIERISETESRIREVK